MTLSLMPLEKDLYKSWCLLHCVCVCWYTAIVLTVKTTGITLCLPFHCKNYRFYSVCGYVESLHVCWYTAIAFTVKTTGCTLCLHFHCRDLLQFFTLEQAKTRFACSIVCVCILAHCYYCHCKRYRF